MFNIVKRTLDIILSLIAIIILSPFFIIISLLIIIDTPGPIFADIPPRVGKGYKPFKMYKFRSMIKDAHRLLKEDPRFRNLYREYKNNNYKLKNDPRITRVGKILRSTSLDEIPQFFNVLIGNMSLVGPRAYYFDELDFYRKSKIKLTKRDVNIVTSVKPGITGIWQISGRSSIPFDKRIQLDLEYVRTQSLFGDLKILLKTPGAVLSKKGAY